MHYRRLGRTEWMVSEVALSARPLASADPATVEETLTAALVAGINLLTVDARPDAPALEELIGRVALRARPHVLLASRMPAGLTAGELAATVEATVERLDAKYLDLVLLAAAPDLEQLDLLEALDALDGCREQGLVRAIGLSTLSALAEGGASAPEQVAAAITDGRIDVIEVALNLGERGAAAAIEQAAAAGLGVIAAAPLDGGALLRAERFAESLRAATDGPPRTPAQAAIAWALSQPGVPAVAVGAATAERAAENADASRVAPLAPRVLASLDG